MKWLLILSIIMVSGNLSAQTTKKTKKDLRQNLQEEYYVSDNNPNIKEGPYKAISVYGNWLRCEGFYKNDQKDSLWKYYDYRPDSSEKHFITYVSKTGFYKNDQKAGVWVFYNSKEEPELKYDFTHKKILFYKKSDDTLKLTEIVLDHPPIFLEGTSNIYKALVRNLRYPKEAKEANIQGKVLIAFTVDTLGKTSNFRIKKDIGFGCGQAALHAAELIEGEWLPAELNGKPVTVEYILPVSFTIEIAH